MSDDTDTPDGETGEVVIPDRPQTALAFRVWRRDRLTLLSLNAPGKGKGTWLARQLADPAGAWPLDGNLVASCDRCTEHDPPGEECTCGIYAATDLDVISAYLSSAAPVLGVVELGGRVIEAEQGYRAAQARVAAILLIDEALTEPHATLRRIAAAYRVPALVPHSVNPEDYRETISTAPLAAEVEDWLKHRDEK